ncbi:ABC transporter permease [Actinobacillus succinogenes]|uniref:Cobalt transport protein n=1 Tax=Actinobacillus succinogenes (strain ATCC 55618 / DSM 22257 / CCUG 43843 / 130Z) TaxID=339671 RepID=A6VMG7_ACTSZ|nr:energy-coupling factor transporter transmembrane component T [Actinobacillus succinogenes]ABR74164.1 cobalt transport protein [Actinobacillus succinogenes 130Z]PHI39405.1 ABC transporter permease [Actinobacillus succinogenes]
MKQAIFQPHFRLIITFVLGLIISALHNPQWLLGLLCLTAGVLAMVLIRQNKPLQFYLRRAILFNLFTLLIWLTLSWRITLNGMAWNPAGVHTALLITLRMNLILCTIWLCLLNITDSILVQAVSKLPLPDKLIQLFILTVRYISLVGELNRQMTQAMKARGFQPKFNRRTFSVTVQRVALLLIRAMVQVEKSEMALKARGFRFASRSSLLDKPWWKTVEISTALLLAIGIYYAQR